MRHRTPSWDDDGPGSTVPMPRPSVRRRPDGVVEIVPARPPPEGRWRGLMITVATSIATTIAVLALAPLALVVAPLFYLAPTFALPGALRSLRAWRARRRALKFGAAADAPRLRQVGR